jgi:hypothetical protein
MYTFFNSALVYEDINGGAARVECRASRRPMCSILQLKEASRERDVKTEGGVRAIKLFLSVQQFSYCHADAVVAAAAASRPASSSILIKISLDCTTAAAAVASERMCSLVSSLFSF